jgi:hypothetical protein
VGENAVTFHGNEDIVISIAHAMRSPQGVVKVPGGSPLGGVLVEVFDHPEVVLKNGPPAQGLQHRLAACITDETGSFDLKLPSGKYEIRFSKSGGWQCTSTLIQVRWFSLRKRLDVVMQVAT